MAVAAAVAAARWRTIAVPQQELCLANTLPTGQSFRWRHTPLHDCRDTYTGVVGQRLVQLRQKAPSRVEYRVLGRSDALQQQHVAAPTAAADADEASLLDYLNLGQQQRINLTELSAAWAAADPRYALIAPHLPGCRLLRQEPVECLFQFICSSNNNISRIHGLVDKLCSMFGSVLLPTAQPLPAQAATADASMPFSELLQQTDDGGNGDDSADEQQQLELSDVEQQFDNAREDDPEFFGQLPASRNMYLAFPTLEQLARATEGELRDAGFGYRAKFIVGTVEQLLAKPGGGEAWLLGLRDRPYAEAHAELLTLPGVGPKVASCICLFALDKHGAIPCDTHVWQLATKHYAPHLASKTLSAKLHSEVEAAFQKVFGEYAGWAHTCLFISELASHRHLLPAGLDVAVARKRRQAAATGAAAAAAASEAAEAAEAAGPVTPPVDAATTTPPPRRRRRRS